MTFDETMTTLESMGTAQNVKVYKRHGAGENLFGVSFANLEKLRKAIRTDHDLACQLWATGNTDARTLALMIADPARLTVSQVDGWLREITYSLLCDYLARLVARSRHALSRLEKWTKQKSELTRVCGYSLVCAIQHEDDSLLSDDHCSKLINRIETEIHGSPNRARHAMNMALCAIGISRPTLRDAAIAAARRIGLVEVDHGETNCTTPDAEAYIRKAAERLDARAQASSGSRKKAASPRRRS